MTTLDVRINIIAQNDFSLIIEFSVPNEWSNIQEISKDATIQDFIELYEAITPNELTNINDVMIMKQSFNN